MCQFADSYLCYFQPCFSLSLNSGLDSEPYSNEFFLNSLTCSRKRVRYNIFGFQYGHPDEFQKVISPKTQNIIKNYLLFTLNRPMPSLRKKKNSLQLRNEARMPFPWKRIRICTGVVRKFKPWWKGSSKGNIMVLWESKHVGSVMNEWFTVNHIWLWHWQNPFFKLFKFYSLVLSSVPSHRPPCDLCGTSSDTCIHFLTQGSYKWLVIQITKNIEWRLKTT